MNPSARSEVLAGIHAVQVAFHGGQAGSRTFLDGARGVGHA